MISPRKIKKNFLFVVGEIFPPEERWVYIPRAMVYGTSLLFFYILAKWILKVIDVVLF